MLATLDVRQTPGRFAFVCLGDSPNFFTTDGWIDSVSAVVREDEGWTVVCETAVAAAHGWAFDFEAAWLTVQVHSALEAVGLTAAISTALGQAGIPCNMLAGHFHDHLLVPHAEAGRAIDCLVALADL